MKEPMTKLENPVLMATIDKIAKQVGSAMKRAGLTKPATLLVVSAGTRTVGAASAGLQPTVTSVKARGLVVQWKRSRLNATIIQNSDRVVMLFGSLIAGGVVPKISDSILIEGETGIIVDIERDAAAATYNCLCR